MMALSDRLTSLNISGGLEDCDEDSLHRLDHNADIAKVFTRLRKICWDAEDEYVCVPMKGILFGTRLSLDTLHVTVTVRHTPTWDFTEVFGRMRSLRYFSYRGRAATHLFGIISRANPMLKIVEICTGPSGRNEDFCLHVVKSFSRCCKLRELFVCMDDSVGGSSDESDGASDNDSDDNEDEPEEEADEDSTEADEETGNDDAVHSIDESGGTSDAVSRNLAAVQTVCYEYCLSSPNAYVTLYGHLYLPIR